MSASAVAAEGEFIDILAAQLQKFCAENINAHEIDATGEIPTRVLEGLADLGMFSLSIPEQFGGAGFSLSSTCRLVALLAEADRSVATTVGLHLGLGTRGLIAYASPELQQEFLPKLASGEWIASFAATEANAGSDLTAIATKTSGEPDNLRLRGSKAYVTNSGFSKVLTLLVATPGLGGARAHSLVALKRDDPGITVGPEEKKLGLKGSSTRPVYLDNVPLPLSRIIGTPGQGMELVYQVLAWGRTAMAAGTLGAARASMNLAIRQVQSRRQFGKALIELAVVRQQIATMSALLFAIEAMVEQTARLENDDAALTTVSTATKVFASEANWEIADTSLQLHGGLGFIEETGIALLCRDARITRIFEGANDVLRIHAGGSEIAGANHRTVPRADHALGAQANRIAERVDEFTRGLRDSMGIRILRDHRQLHAIGSAVIWREAADSVANLAIERGDAHSELLAAHFLDLAEQRLQAVLAPLPDKARVDALADAIRN